MITPQGLEMAVMSMVTRPLILRLFVNDVMGPPFVEAAGAGYLAHSLNPSEWSFQVSERGCLAQHTAHTFEFTDRMGKVYGSYITDHGGKIMQYQRGQEPFLVAANRDRLTVEARIGLTI